MGMHVPFNDLSRFAKKHADKLRELVERVVVSGRYILDNEVAEFEKSFADFVGTTYAVGVNSGTDALALALRALGVHAGDEVITVANTATATIAAIRISGSIPVFADIDVTHTMDPADLEKRITRKTKAIVPVHLYGFPADMSTIMAVAKKHQVPVLEDAAQAHGATVGKKHVGSLGHMGAFSFYPTKNLGALGDGGAIVTNDQDFFERAKRLRAYGERARYDSIEEGVNSRLDEIQAAIISFRLNLLEEANARRRGIAEVYLREMKNPAVELPMQSVGDREGVWHLFVVQVDNRGRFIEHMQKCGVGTSVHYPKPAYHQDAYSFLRVDPADYPVTERIVPRVVSLPLFPEMTDAEIETVIAAINEYQE